MHPVSKKKVRNSKISIKPISGTSKIKSIKYPLQVLNPFEESVPQPYAFNPSHAIQPPPNHRPIHTINSQPQKSQPSILI